MSVKANLENASPLPFVDYDSATAIKVVRSYLFASSSGFKYMEIYYFGRLIMQKQLLLPEVS